MPLPIYFAPLEGVTDAPFRRVHSAMFTGVDKYFIPFISPTQNLIMTSRELHAVAPEHNAGVRAIPQVLTKEAEHFLWAARTLYDMGYGEVNLNLGCPSGTVTAKGKGSGMLTNLPHLEAFLDEIYAHAPMPISIKTRIGFTSPDEFDALLALLAHYPVHELIIHPRTRVQFYKGRPHMPSYAKAHEACTRPLVYNGDLFSARDCEALAAQYPRTKALMLGRGLIANPALARRLAGGPDVTADELRSYHDALLEAYLARYPKNVALGRMIGIMNHLSCCFESPEKPRKAVRKARTLEAYQDAAAALFARCALRENPCFIPE